MHRSLINYYYDEKRVLYILVCSIIYPWFTIYYYTNTINQYFIIIFIWMAIITSRVTAEYDYECSLSV